MELRRTWSIVPTEKKWHFANKYCLSLQKKWSEMEYSRFSLALDMGIEKAKCYTLILAQGQVNGHKGLVQRKFYLP